MVKSVFSSSSSLLYWKLLFTEIGRKTPRKIIYEAFLLFSKGRFSSDSQHQGNDLKLYRKSNEQRSRKIQSRQKY